MTSEGKVQTKSLNGCEEERNECQQRINRSKTGTEKYNGKKSPLPAQSSCCCILHVTSVTLKPYTHSATDTDTHAHNALTSTWKQRPNRRRSPQSALTAPPQWILGQVVFTSRAEGKPRLPGHKTLQTCWLFEAGKWEFISAWACITPASRLLPRWSGEEFRHTVPLGLCQHRPEPTLCSLLVCGCMSDCHF